MKPAAYPASEDTYLLMDVLKKDEDILRGKVEIGGVCIEIGSGSGEVSSFLNHILPPNAFLISTDVNKIAMKKTRQAVDSARAQVLRGDLFSFFLPNPTFDVIIFNPPYVPTDDDEFQRSLIERDISASWAGGRNGREVTDRFLRCAKTYLRQDGLMYLVVIDVNDVYDTMHYARNLGYRCSIAGERVAGIEKLYVLRLAKDSTSR